jgi:hypothetical protein
MLRENLFTNLGRPNVTDSLLIRSPKLGALDP